MMTTSVADMWVLLVFVVMATVRSDSYMCDSSKQPVQVTSNAHDASVPPYPTADIPDISVIIESYRDVKCRETINNLFKNAKNPKNLHIGVINHVNVEPPVDTDCVAQYCALHPRGTCPYHEQIRSVIINRREYRGRETALVHADTLIGDSEFCLMLTPGVTTATQWDDSLVSQWTSLQNEFAMLSSPLPLASVNSKEVPYSIGYTYNARRLPKAMPPTAASLTSPLLTNTYHSDFSFGKCHSLVRVPYDPQLIRLDTSYTDALRFARLWTHGYDIYTWSTPTLFKIAVTAANDEWARFGMTPGVIINEFDASLVRVKSILGMSPVSTSTLLSFSQFGLGTVRSLDEVIKFMMVDLRSGTIYAMRCEQLMRVPYSYVVDTTDPYSDPNSIWGFRASQRTAQPTDLISIPLASITKPTSTKITISTSSSASSSGISDVPIISNVNAAMDVVIASIDSSMQSMLHIKTPLMGAKIFLLALPILLILGYVLVRALVVVEHEAEQLVSNYRTAKDT